MAPTRYQVSRDGIVLAVYLLLALVLTYPLVTHLTTHGPGHGVDDPAQTWSLWWFNFAIFNLDTSPLYTDYLFYPLGINLVAYTPTFLNGLISIPLQFVFGVVVAQNLIVFFSLVAGGYGTSLFVKEILSRFDAYPESSRRLAAAMAGAVYAFGAWHINYVVAGHFMLLSDEWIPYFALYLIRLNLKPWRNGVLAGLFFVLAVWTELTFAPFLAILTALYFVYVILCDPSAMLRTGVKDLRPQREPPSTGRRGELVEPSGQALPGVYPKARRVQGNHRTSLAVNLIALGVFVGIGVSPLALNLFDDIQRYGYYLTSGVGRIQILSAEPISFFFPSAQHPLLGAWSSSITNANTSYAFVGYAVLILASLGIYFHRAARAARFWMVAAILFALLMLGPALIVGGQITGIPLPFAPLRFIPFINANRYPVRFNVMMILALTPLVALGTAWLMRTARGAIALSALTALLAFEQLVLPIPLSDLRVPTIFQTIGDAPGDFAVLDLPLGWRGSTSLQGKLEDRAEFYQTVHNKRVLGGITSRAPRFKFQYFLEAPVINSLIALETGGEIDEVRLAQDRIAAPKVLNFFNILYVDVQRTLTDPKVLDYVRDVFPLTEIYRDETRIVYRVARPVPSDDTIDLRDETARLYFDDRWGRVQFAADGTGYRWATRSDAGLWLPFSHADYQIKFRSLAPRPSQKIVVRVNGQSVAELNAADTWKDFVVRVPAVVLRDGLGEIIFSSETAPINATRQDPYTIGDTGTVAPVDIAATGAGFNAGRFGEIFVAGRNVIENRRGYHLVAIDPRGGKVDQIGWFDTFSDANESRRLAEWVDSLPRGEIVAGVAVDEVSRELQQEAVDALRQLGIESDLRFQFRMGHAFIGVKGAQPGQALEQVDGRWPANVAVGKNVSANQVSFALGSLSYERIGQ